MNKVAIIGSGPSGITCAIFASKNKNTEIDVYDIHEPLMTLLPTGGGRCNLAYSEYETKTLAKYYPRGEKFLYSVFNRFSTADTINFFESIGIKTYTQDDKRIFPISNSSKEMRTQLISYAKSKNIKFIQQKIDKIKQKEDKFEINNKMYDILVIATGGKGNGHNLAKNLGHTISELHPALTALTIKEDFYENLSGLTLKNINAKVTHNKHKMQLNGDLMFTHMGITGPLAYKISSYYALYAFNSKNPINAILDITNYNEQEIKDIFSTNKKKAIKNNLRKIIPLSLVEAIFKDFDIEKESAQITKKEFSVITERLKHLQITITGIQKNGEIVTAGGVDLNEIDSKTMESKIIKNLYFVGEILNIDGLTGGFNLQNCWSTGYLAGYSIAKY